MAMALVGSRGIEEEELEELVVDLDRAQWSGRRRRWTSSRARGSQSRHKVGVQRGFTVGAASSMGLEAQGSGADG